jgi:MFS family permease
LERADNARTLTPRRPLPLIARYTWRRQWPAWVLEGIGMGAIGLAFFAVKRTLGGPEWIVPLLIGLWQLPWIFSPAVGTLLARAHPQRVWRWTALIAHLPVLCVVFVAVRPTAEAGHGTGSVTLFLVLMFLYYAVAVVYIPHRGALLRTNYPRAIRGRFFGFLTALGFLASGLASKVGGYLLDLDPRHLRVLFPVAALFGMAGFLLHSRIRWRHQRRESPYPAVAAGPLQAMRLAWREAFRILREDRAFRDYEIGFMLYGFGFLTSIGLIVLYAEEELAVSYDTWTWATGVFFPLLQILAAAPVGRLADRLGIVRTTAIAFSVLVAFFLAMMFVTTGAGLVAAYALFGVGMAGVMVGWNLGPLNFAPDRQGHMYFAVHFSLVVVRSVIAPFLGFAVLRLLSYQAAFALSAAFMLCAVIVLLRLARRVA